MTVSPEHAEIALPLIRDLIDRDWPSPDTLEWSALSAVQQELEWIIQAANDWQEGQEAE